MVIRGLTDDASINDFIRIYKYAYGTDPEDYQTLNFTFANVESVLSEIEAHKAVAKYSLYKAKKESDKRSEDFLLRQENLKRNFFK